MGYASTTGVILYWKLDQPFIIHISHLVSTGVILYCKPDQNIIVYRAHHVWFDEYNSCISIEDKHTPGSLVLRQYPEGHIHYSYPLNLIPCKLDLTSTPFIDETIITYYIELPPSGKKIGFNLLDDEYFTITYITDTIPNSPAVCQLPLYANRNVWIVAINGEEPITAQGVLDELNHHQTPRGKSNIKIRLCRRKNYQSTYLE